MLRHPHTLFVNSCIAVKMLSHGSATRGARIPRISQGPQRLMRQQLKKWGEVVTVIWLGLQSNELRTLANAMMKEVAGDSELEREFLSAMSSPIQQTRLGVVRRGNEPDLIVI